MHPPRPVFLNHLTHYVPDGVLDNHFFAGFQETSDEWIRKHVGIGERRFMRDYRGSFPVFEIGRRAVDRLLETTPFALDDVDVLVSCSCNDDLQYPGPGNMLSEHYGLEVPAFHMKNGCSSVVYGLEVARGLLQTGAYRNVLVVNGEPFTRFTDYADRTSSMLFGDAASAFVVSTDPGAFQLLDVELGGRGSRVINATAPGARPEQSLLDVHPDGAQGALFESGEPGLGRFQQEGRDVYDFVVNSMPDEIVRFTDRMGISVGDFDWFIGHQANLRMLEVLCDKLGVEPDRHLHNVERNGNVSSAGWVTVLSEELAADRFEPGERILVSAFGAGLAWGTLALAATEWVA